MILVIEVERPTVRHPNDLRVGCQCSAVKSAPNNNGYHNGRSTYGTYDAAALGLFQNHNLIFVTVIFVTVTDIEYTF